MRARPPQVASLPSRVARCETLRRPSKTSDTTVGNSGRRVLGPPEAETSRRKPQRTDRCGKGLPRSWIPAVASAVTELDQDDLRVPELKPVITVLVPFNLVFWQSARAGGSAPAAHPMSRSLTPVEGVWSRFRRRSLCWRDKVGHRVPLRGEGDTSRRAEGAKSVTPIIYGIRSGAKSSEIVYQTCTGVKTEVH